MTEPAESPSLDNDLTICATCGDPSVRWVRGPMGRPQGACNRHSEPSIAHAPGAPTAEQRATLNEED